MGLVLTAFACVFGLLPFTYGAEQDRSVRAEASSAAQMYMDGVRSAIQSSRPLPIPMEAVLSTGASLSTGERNDSVATLDLAATCTQPDGVDSLLYDCTVTQQLVENGQSRALPSLESYVTRQL